MKSLSNVIKGKNDGGTLEDYFDEHVFYPRLNDPQKEISAAKKEAFKILQDAQTQAIEHLSRFREEGIRQAVNEVQPLSMLLESVIAEMQAFKQQALAELEPLVVDLALAIAQRIVREEIDKKADLVRTTVQAALKNMVNKRSITIYLHPADKDLLEKHQKEIVRQFRDIEELTLAANESISRGGCYIKTTGGDLDATIETQLEQMARAYGRSFNNTQ